MNIKSVLVLIVAVMGLGWVGCKKEDTCNEPVETAPAQEVIVLEKYLTDNNIQATKDPHGFYYIVEAAGNGDHPNTCSEVLVNYKGTLTTGKVFDQANNVQFDLGGLIKGWKAGIPLIAKGGKIILYIPPSLGYGSEATNSIPANSILIFSIDLLKVY